MGLFDRDDIGRTAREGDAPKKRAPEPGKYAGTDNYGSGGPALIPAVPGKRSGTDQLDVATSAYGAQPIMRAPGIGKYALSAYGAGDPAPATTDGGGSHQAPRASRENFEIQAWSAAANEPPMRVGTPASGDHTSIAVQATGIAAHATVRALTPEAQQYSVGYVQTIHSSRRQAVYESEPGVVAATWLETRGTMLDQRTDLGSPAPWYNYGLSLGSAPRSPSMTDNPYVAIPEYSEDYALLARLEGSESFTTYLVAMVGNDSSTIVYLGNVHWSVAWTGRFNESYTTFSGGRGTVGAATRSADGGAVLSGPAANHGPPGSFTSGGGGRSRGAHAWGAYGSAAAAQSHYGDDAASAAHIQELRTQIDQAWAQMLTTAEADVSEPGLARWKIGVYRRLITEPAAPSTIPSLLAYLGADTTKAGLNTAAVTARDSFNLDRPRIASLQAATNRFIGGGEATDASIALMTDYPNVTSLGRAYISELPWVNNLETYAARSALEDGNRIASGGGEARTQQTRTMLGILRGHGTGVFQTAPDAQPAAAPGAPGPPAAQASTWTPDKQREFERLRQRIIDLCPQVRTGHEAPQEVNYQQLQTLAAELRRADHEVQDHLTADTSLTQRMQASMTGFSMRSLASAMDSVQGLVAEVQGTLPAGRTQYDIIRDYLSARAGTGPTDEAARTARMRVVNNADLGAVIANFDAEHHQNILRLATRGTLARDPVDDIYDAARGSAGVTAETALRAMMRMRANRAQLDELQANPLFRDAIQHLQTPVTVDGLSCSPYDYMMRLWGFNPRETGDPAAARPTEVNPDGNTEPLSPDNWRTIDTLFTNTVNQLVGRLARPTVLLFTDSWTSDSAVVSILTGFENACAQDPMRGLLRRGHIMPGQELTQRANARSEIQDIRERLHRCVGEDARQQCERVLNIRIDAAAVGQVGGSVRTAQDGIGAPDGTHHVPLAQAIREVTFGGPGGITITQSARETAVIIADSLATHWYRATRRDPADSLSAWHTYRNCFTPQKKQELSRLTGIAEVDIHPIEFLVNIFREVPNGGDLATRIATCVTESRVQDVLTDFGLQPAQVAERAVRHGEAPPEASPADRFGPAATQLWQAIRSWNVPLDDVTAFSPTGLQTVAQRFSAGMQVAGPPGGAATAQPQAPRVVEGPLPGEHQPARVDGNADAPATFAAYYRSTYGIDPDRHVIEFGRSVLTACAQKRDAILHPHMQGHGQASREPTEEERQRAETWNITPQQLAGYLHVEAAQFSAAVQAPTERAEVTDANRAQLPVGYTERDAQTAARTIWDLLRGSGDIVLIRDQINAKRAEEVRLINIEFRRLSGGIDLAFYLRQSADDNSGTWGLAVGGDGVREAGQASSQHVARALGDTGSMIETADLAQTNRIGILTRVRNAVRRSDKNELFREVGQATPAEKRQVLGDAATMDAIRQNLSETEFDRVFADLNGTLDMAGMLWSRSSEASTWGTTDTQGMQADIRDYMRRRREFHTQQLEQGGREVDQQEVERRVREDALRAYSNPSVRTVIETECRSLFRSGPNSDAHQMTGMIMNAGTDPGTGALLGNNWANVGELITAIRAMEPAQRARWRNDPEFWMRVDALGPTPSQRQDIISALNGTEAAGSDHLDIVRRGVRYDVGENEMKEALAHLSAAEIQRLQADPSLVAELQSRFQYSEEMRTILNTLVGSRHGADAAQDLGAHPRMGPDGRTPAVDAQGRPIYDLPNTTGDISTAEIERLEALKTSAIVRLRYGAERSWEQLLREAVEVFRMDFRPQANPAAPAAQAQATQPATAASTQASAPAAPGPQRRQTDRPASTFRAAIWTNVSEAIRTKADDDTKHHTIEQAVKAEHDPSQTLMREFLGSVNDSESDILATIRGASNDLIVDEWSSINHLKYLGSDGFNYSYKTAYDDYKRLRDHQPAPPAGAGGAPPPQSAELQTARLNFQRYRIEPSAGFETLLLPHAGNDAFDIGGPGEARRYRTTRDGDLHRDNPEWHQWRDALLERINGLSVDDKLRGLGAESDPDARAIVGSRLATAEQSFQRAQEDHAFQRGDGNSFFGDEHGRELDRAFGDYGTALGQGEDSARRQQAQTGRTTDITDAQGRALGRYDANYTQRSQEYAQAREEAAHWAGLVVAAVIGVAVTALTAGAGGVAMVAMWGAISGAAAATGDTLTHEMILGRTYDASGEGLRNIATGAVTGMVAAGSQFYAGQIIRSLSGVATEATGTALQQATRVAGVAEQTAPGWRAMFQQAGRGAVTAGVQTGLTGFANAAGTMLSPDIWVHGWDEGWVRAQMQIGTQLRAIPMDVLRTTISTMLASIRAPGGAESSLPTVQAGQRIGADRVLAEIVHQLPQNLRQGAIDAALQGQTTPQGLAGGAAQQGLMGMRDVGQGLHDGSAQEAHAVRFAQRELLAHGTEFVSQAEALHYIQTVIGGHDISAREYLTARESVARAYMNGSTQPLSDAQRTAFVRWCREAPSAEQFRQRMQTNPGDVEAVRNAGTTTTPPATDGSAASTGTSTGGTGATTTVDPHTPAGQARQHATAAQQAVEHARGASETALRAEDAYHANRSAESGQRAITDIRAAETSAREQVAAAQRAVDAIQGMLRTAADGDRAAIEQELARAREALTVATGLYNSIHLSLTNVQQEVNPTEQHHAPDPQPHPQGGGTGTDAHPQPTAREQLPRQETMSPEQWMLLQHLIAQHGSERGLHEWRNIQEGRTAEGVEINASIIPGSGFIGTGRARPEPAAVLAEAHAQFTALQGLFPGQVTGISRAGDTYTVSLADGTSMRVTLRSTQLTYVEVARTQVNTQRGDHTIFLSDRAAQTEIARALAHELGEILAETRNARSGDVPTRVDVLHGGAHTDGPLSNHDFGRIAELNQLALQLNAPGISTAEQARLRREVLALVDHLGLREGTTEGRQRKELLLRAGALSPEANTMLFAPDAGLARAAPRLSQADRDTIADIRDTASRRDEAQIRLADERQRPRLDPLQPSPDVLAGGRVPLAEQERMAQREADARQRKSDATISWLRGLHAARAAGTDFAVIPNPVQIGGGATTTALTGDTVFIDARQRWHQDAAPELAQTAQQVQGLHGAGMGDPHQFASPDARLPMPAVRAFEDHLAAQAQVINGTATIEVLPDGRRLLVVTPDSGDRTPIRVVLGNGSITVATGVTRERAPGESRSQSPQESVRLLRERYLALGGDPALLGGNTGATDAEAAQVRRLLADAAARGDAAALQVQTDQAEAWGSLSAVQTWEGALAADRAAGQRRALRGDEACRTSTYATNPVREWVIAGTGGIAISAAEVILLQTTIPPRDPALGPVTVRMMGRDSAAGLQDNPQWRALEERFGGAPDPSRPDRGRLRIDQVDNVAGVSTGANGEVNGLRVNDTPGAAEHTVAAGGIIVALGGRSVMPPTVESVVTEARAAQARGEPGVVITAALMWGRDSAPRSGDSVPTDESPGRYLGYRITVTRNGQTTTFNVTGAQSRTLPPEFFPSMQRMINAAGDVDASSTSGNFAPGLQASAQQARDFQARSADGTLYLMNPSGSWQ